MFKGLTAILFALALAACSQGTPVTGSAWQLNGEASDLTFVSVKNGDVAEVSRFGAFSGQVDADGNAGLVINPASVETYVDIRNERLRDIFFNVAEFAEIRVNTSVAPDLFEDLVAGQSVDTELELSVTLRGTARTVYAPVTVTRAGADRMLVVSREPALVDVRDFGLEAPVETLRGIAGLNSITPVFPVSAYLVFERA